MKLNFNYGELVKILTLIGAIGGQGPKWAKRFVYPGIITVYSYIILKDWKVIFLYFLSFVLAMGYGRFDVNDSKVSHLGMFYNKVFPKSVFLQDVFIRGTVGVLMCVCLIILPVIHWNWGLYFIVSCGVIMSWAFISWRGFGEIPFKLFNTTYKLLKVDIINYLLLTILIIILIHG